MTVVMNLFTDREYHLRSLHYVFRLKNLLLSDEQTFYQLQDCLPNPTFIDNSNDDSYDFFNEVFLDYGEEIEHLYEIGKSYLPNISNHYLMNCAS